MVGVEALQLLLAVAMCIITSITDIKKSRIANRHLAIFAIIATVLNLIYYVFFARSLIFNFIINIIIISIISVIFYIYKIWAAGDTKLLIALVYLLPARIFYDDLSVSPSIWIIIASFSVALIYLVGESIVLGVKRRDFFKLGAFKLNFFEYAKQYLMCTVYLSFFSEIIALPPFAAFAENNSALIMLMNMLLLISVLNLQIFRNPTFIIIAAIGAIGMGVYAGFSMFRSFDLKWLPITLVIILVRYLSEQYNYKVIDTEEIKVGMILSWVSIALFAPSRVQGLPRTTTEDMDSRLTEKQVQDILRWKDSKYGQAKLTIVRKMPFAIFISIGFILFCIMRFFAYGN
ncbi:MAG: hypothetical protein LBT59_24685 [Clostridiales bacterium]|nr:hypothetical protein [Clostridiales bacterium]